MDCCNTQITIVQGSDGTINFTCWVNQNGCKIPFNLTGASEIKVCLPNTDGTILALLLSLSQVSIANGPLGQGIATYTNEQSPLLLQGICDLQVVVIIDSLKTIFILPGGVSIIPESYPGE